MRLDAATVEYIISVLKDVQGGMVMDDAYSQVGAIITLIENLRDREVSDD